LSTAAQSVFAEEPLVEPVRQPYRHCKNAAQLAFAEAEAMSLQASIEVWGIIQIGHPKYCRSQVVAIVENSKAIVGPAVRSPATCAIEESHENSCSG
jgi:hypothetical protein